jgi:hypothetical protein
MRILVAGVDDAGYGLAELVGAFLSRVLPHISIATSDLRAEASEVGEVPPRADGAILCVTPTSLSGDRIFLTAGLMHGAVGLRGFVAPLLLDLKPEDVSLTPLGLFQATTVAREEMLALTREIIARSTSPEALSLLEAFDREWESFYQQSRYIPGPAPSDLIISLAVQSRLLSFRFRPGENEDARWDETIGVILKSLPSSPLSIPPFDSTLLEILDVEASRWVYTPALLSRAATSHLALVDQSIVDQWHGDARLGSRQLRESLPANGVMDTFLKVGDQIVLMRSTR